MPNPFNVAVPNVAQSLLGFQRARKLRSDAKTSAQSREIALERLGLLKSSQEQQAATTAANQQFRQGQATRAQANSDRAFNEGQRQFGISSGLKRQAIKAKSAGLKNLTPGQKKTDQIFAKEFVEFSSSGGFADIGKQIKQLDGVITTLETDSDITGPIRGNVPDVIGAQTEQGRKAINAREQVEEVVQRNLRLILGAQFTEREGERLIARAFNPLLEEKENAKRVRNLIQQMKTAAEQKRAASEYFEANGTLSGFKGKLPSLGDFGTSQPGEGQTESGVNFRIKQ